MAGSGLLADAAERLEAFARRGLRTPGLVVALVGPDGWRQEFAVGVAGAQTTLGLLRAADPP